MVQCPVCSKLVHEAFINPHIDSGCIEYVQNEPKTPGTQSNGDVKKLGASSFFTRVRALQSTHQVTEKSSPTPAEYDKHREFLASLPASTKKAPVLNESTNGVKRSFDDAAPQADNDEPPTTAPKRAKSNALEKAAPLAERMRPRSLDDVCGQELVGPNGILRGLIEGDRVPSMVLWGGPGTGKTTIARLIARTAGTRFVEINSTSSGVGECKKLFSEAKNELSLTGRKTIIFCDEIHRFSKSQQDVFLGPVEAGQVTLVGATTENPSFKVISALLSRCRVFTLDKLSEADILTILQRALAVLQADVEASQIDCQKHLLDEHMLHYIASFADGDARTALNLLDLAFDLSKRSSITQGELKKSLTHTLVYDRAGDQHYDTISAFHKSVRGSDADAALYYLARMLQSGEDALYIARRIVVIASEDIGIGDNTILPLCTAAYTACERIGMPECRINLAHATVALCQAKKSTRAYRGLGNAMAALREPGITGLPIPVHLRNAPTKLMKEMGYGAEYKYNPNYKDGRVLQEYLPEKLHGKTFLEDLDLGTEIDPDLGAEEQSLSFYDEHTAEI